MTPPLLPTAYLPTIEYFALLAKHAVVNIEQQETYHKQTYRNRTVILTANGLLPLSVPAVLTYGNHTYTKDVGIAYTERWNVQHWRAIESAYNASPYFLYYRDGIEKILMQRYNRLIELNDALLQYLLKKIKIDCEIRYTNDYAFPAEELIDYRTTLSPKRPSIAKEIPPYDQVFGEKFEFQPRVSILDALFNLGPETKQYLSTIKWQ